MPNVTLTSNADWKAPTGNLFSLKPGEGAGYLVETDPLFTDKNKWTGSDYFLTQLRLDPQRALKRYGDGFVEQRAFADQLINITGRNKLSGYENNEQAFTALMDSGVAYAKQFQLTPGVALSEQQMAQLTTDIVWLQKETVTLPDGSTTEALVPQVYLRRPQQGDLSTGGALIAGDNVTIRNQNGSISNSGTILAGYANAKPTDMHGAVRLDARDVTNRGTIAGNVIDIRGRDSIANLGGSLTGLSNTGLNGTVKDDSRISLAGRDITVASTTQTRSVDTVGKNGTSMSSRTNVDRVATIAGGNVVINADGNFTARGARIGAGNNLAIFAGKNIDVSAVQETHALFVPLGGTNQGRTGYSNESSVSNVGTVLKAGGNVVLKATGDATLNGSYVAAGDSVNIAGANVSIAAVKDRTMIDLQTIRTKGYDRAMDSDESLSGGTVNAGKNVTISATGVASGQKDKDGKAIAQAGTGNLVLSAGTVVAETGVAKLLANNDLTVQEITTQHDSLRDSYSKSRTLGGSRMSSSTSTESLQQVTGSKVGGDSVLAGSGKDLTVSGSMIAGVNDVSLKAVAGNVTIKSAEEIYKERNSAVQKQSGFTAGYAGGVASVGYNKSSSSGQSSLDLVSQAGSTIKSTAGKVSVAAGEGIKVVASELNAKTDLSLSGKTVDLLAAQNTSDEHSAYQSASKGISVGVTLDPKAAYSNARNQSEKGNSADSGVGKLTKRADGMAEGVLAAFGGVVLQAGSRTAAGTKDHVSSIAQASTLRAGGNLSIDATGGSITSEGATLKAEGNASLTAKDSILLGVAHSTESEGQDNKAKGWSIDSRGSLPVGMFNNKDNGNGSADTIRGTTLSVGGNASLKSTDGDIVLTATRLAAEKDVAITAGRNLTIQSGQDTLSNDNHSNNKAIGKVVVSDTERFAGYNNVKKNGSNDAVTQVQSSVASINGNITLKAGEKYTQTSSNVLANNDVSVTAKSIEIGTAANTFNSAQDSSDLKIGGFARISSPLIDLANNRKAAEESDGRLSTMQNMAAAANAYQAVSAAAGGSGTLFKAEAGIGIATAKSRDQSSGSKAIGSTLTGTNGNVTLTTTEGDIKATGAGITAGKELKLDSARDIVLESATSQTSSEGKNNNAGVEVGVGVQVGAKTGTYVYATANVGKGEYDNDATVNTNIKLTGGTVTIASKGDTTLKGAVVNGDSITANVGGKLAIESMQDTNKQHNEQINAGARVQLSLGSAWEASGNIGRSVADGSSKVVLEQSGLFAGDGGYHVKADTIALKGGAIGSTNAANSDLTAKAIRFENLDNQMNYKAQSVTLSRSLAGGGTGENAPKQTSSGAPNPSITPPVPALDKGGDRSTTFATLTDGKISIGGQEMTTAAGLGAHTDLATANEKIEPLKDMKTAMADQKAMTAAAGTVVATSQQIVSDLSREVMNRFDAAGKDAKSASDAIVAANAVLNDPGSSPEQRAQATLNLGIATQSLAMATTTQKAAIDDAQHWGPGGDYARAVSVVTDVIVGGLSGKGAGEVVATVSAPYVFKAVGDLAESKTKPYTDAKLLKKEIEGRLDTATDPAERSRLQQAWDRADATMLQFQGQYDDWQDGSVYKSALHATATAILSKVGGGDPLKGLVAGATNEAISPMLAQWTENLDPATKKFAADLGSLLVGASIGGASMAELTSAAELNNRQLHARDYEQAARLTKLSNGKYSEKELLDALRWSGVSDGKKLLVEPGHLESYAVNPSTNLVIGLPGTSTQGWKPLHQVAPGMSLTPIPGDQLLLTEKLPTAPTSDILNFIRSNTGGTASPYVFAAPAQPAALSGPRFPPPPNGLTRGTVMVDGNLYFPLLGDCPLGCMDRVALAIKDPGTSEYLRALDEKAKRDAVLNVVGLLNPLKPGFGLVGNLGRTAGRGGLAAEVGAGGTALGPVLRGAEDVAIVPGLTNGTRAATAAEIDAALSKGVDSVPKRVETRSPTGPKETPAGPTGKQAPPHTNNIPEKPKTDDLATVPATTPTEVNTVNGKPILELFGGKNAQTPGAINLDIRPDIESGVRASATQLPFRDASLGEIIATNPYMGPGGKMMDYLPEAARVVEPGGKIFINANRANPYGKLPSQAELDSLGLRVVQDTGTLDARFANQTFQQTNGTQIKDLSTMRTIILERVK